MSEGPNPGPWWKRWSGTRPVISWRSAFLAAALADYWSTSITSVAEKIGRFGEPDILFISIYSLLRSLAEDVAPELLTASETADGLLSVHLVYLPTI